MSGHVERHAHQEREAFLFTGPAVWVQDETMRTVNVFGGALTAPKQPHSYCPLRTERPAWMLALKFDPVAVEAYLLARLAFAL